MKIKQSKPLSLKTPLIVFFIFTIICTAIRFYQVFSLIEPQTGFYKNVDFTVYALFILLSIGSAFIACYCYINKKTLPEAFPSQKNKAIGIVGILTALALFFDFFFSLAESASTNVASVGTGNVEGIRALMKTGSLPLFFQAITAIFCGVYFLMIAKSYLKGNTNFRKHRILALTPVCWSVLRMIRRFVRQISFVNVSDILLELMMIAFMLLFFMAFAQLASQIYEEGTLWRLAGFGLPAVMLSIVTSFPRFVIVLMGKGGEMLNEYHPFYPYDLLIAAFILILIFAKEKETVSFPTE